MADGMEIARPESSSSDSRENVTMPEVKRCSFPVERVIDKFKLTNSNVFCFVICWQSTELHALAEVDIICSGLVDL